MPADPVEKFIARWSDTERAERANKDLFLTELCDLLSLPHPDPAGPDNAENAYVFERAVPLHHADGRVTTGKIDLYRRDSFVLEAKQSAADARPENQPAPSATPFGELALGLPAASFRRDPYGKAMLEARVQAERYARNLPDSEPPPPFVVILDVGHSFELFADFTQKGKAFLPFPDPRTHRVLLTDLRGEKIRARLRALWLDPLSLDPAKASAAVTRQAARYLAALAKSFEQDGHDPRAVSAFITRCLFCMFAEDVGLLPKDGFRNLLESLRATPHGVAATLENLFRELNTGTAFSTVLRVKLLHFNGGLFRDSSALPVSGTQLGLLIDAARLQWREVEPAIFGTLLERALDPAERHKLGAHYTPRPYVERLVLPAVIEPLRAEWRDVLTGAIAHAESGHTPQAQAAIFNFHRRLCSLRVLDPACGSGNFLYVTLSHFKILEGEVLEAYERFGGGRRTERGPRGIGAETVDPHQFLGLELNPRAAAIAELVLWIGYLQWHYRTLGSVAPAEPVLRNFKNIEERDAVLAYDGPPGGTPLTRSLLALMGPAAVPGLPKNWHDTGFAPGEKAHPNQLLTFWDRDSTKIDPATGLPIPDESKRVIFRYYPNPSPAVWPAADYIVGNPPFLGKGKMRDDLGDGYVETLRNTYPDVPDSADFVMYWWHKAAELAIDGRVQRFGFITTNSIKQTFNRRIVKRALIQGLSLRFAIPDHPWVDTADGASVRIAMTVGARTFTLPPTEVVEESSPPDPSAIVGELCVVKTESPGAEGEYDVELTRLRGRIGSGLQIGAELEDTRPLKANDRLASTGLILGSRGFVLTSDEAAAYISRNRRAATIIHPLRNGEDLTGTPRNAYVIDPNGLTEEALRERHPEIYQRLISTVKPERVTNRDPKLRKFWWLFRRSNEQVRAAMAGLPRYIATVETAKHRLFQFLDAAIKPEHVLIVIGSADAFHLGVLSSRIHGIYALAAGGTLENRPRYNKSRCFDPFPFPDTTPQQAATIRALAEEIDAHRKRVQTRHGTGLTEIYNLLGKLRAGATLTKTETNLNEIALVATLRHLHDELDAAVAAAYEWPINLTDEEVLEHIIALNSARAIEEARGKIRWLRPEFQAPAQDALSLDASKKPKRAKTGAGEMPEKPRGKLPWPKNRTAQVDAVARVLHTARTPQTPADLAAHFSRPNKTLIAEILVGLVIIGRAQKAPKPGTYLPELT